MQSVRNGNKAISRSTKPRDLPVRTGLRRVRVSRSLGGNFVLFIMISLLGIFFMIPLFYAIITSLKPLNEIFIYPPRFFVIHPTMDNFRSLVKVATDSWVPFERYVFNSIFVATAGTALYVITASMAAYPLAKKKSRFMTFYYQVVVWAILFRPEVTMVPQYLFISRLVMLDTYWAMILPMMASSLGVFLMRQNILTIPDDTLEAARIDGASEYRIFFTIIMPVMKPAWLTLIIFTFRDLWNAPGSSFIYDEAMKSLPTMLQQIASAGISRAGVGAAVAVVLMLPPIIVFLVSQSSVMETMSNSGLKG